MTDFAVTVCAVFYSLSLLNEKKKDIYDYFKLEIMALTHNLYIYRFLQPVRFLKKEIFC